GRVGARAALRMTGGKCVLLRPSAGMEAMPLSLEAREPVEVVTLVRALAPALGGVLLEGIATPACFEIERLLRQSTEIPIFHDAQHGTAVVVLAALQNAARLTGRDPEKVHVVIH